jgi:orotidine-5'-phosphate decarboxylase
MQARDRLIVAADLSDGAAIVDLARSLRDVAGRIKIGLQAFVANGPDLVRGIIDDGHQVFLDLKLHDIPNTVEHAVREAETLGVSMLTVHAAGGEAMLRAARSEKTTILGVTILTSIGNADLGAVGFSGSAEENVVRLARLAQTSGCGGVVASPLEIAAIRAACGPALTIVTPGIRPAGSAAGDQQRAMTPAEAIRAGADFIVVGRPITGAPDPREAALKIVEEMKRAG